MMHQQLWYQMEENSSIPIPGENYVGNTNAYPD